MCDRPGECSNGVSCRLVLRNVDTGLETIEYYCRAHLVARIMELEEEERLAVVDATPL